MVAKILHVNKPKERKNEEKRCNYDEKMPDFYFHIYKRNRLHLLFNL